MTVIKKPRNWINIERVDAALWKYYQDLGLYWLPQGKHGSVEIRRTVVSQKRSIVPLLNLRESLFQQVCFDVMEKAAKRTSLSFSMLQTDLAKAVLNVPNERTICELLIDGDRMMSTNISEITAMALAAKNLRGKVLIGGLGLGLITTFALLHRGSYVDSVTVVEKNNDVIKLVWPALEKRVGANKSKLILVEGDIFDAIRKYKRLPYHSIFLDTWSSTGEHCWQENVVPLRRMIKKRKPLLNNIQCWSEEVMLGQLIGLPPCHNALVQINTVPRRFAVHNKTLWVFQQATEGMFPTRIKTATHVPDGLLQQSNEQAIVAQTNLRNKYYTDLLMCYLTQVGSAEWEAMFGSYWDNYELEVRGEGAKNEKG